MKKLHLVVSPLVVGASLALILAAGCASAPPRSNDSLVRAHAAVDQAERSGAAEFAPEYLAAAHEKLTRADDDQRHDRDGVRVSRLADEAQADAQLAAARARAKKSQLAANQVGKGVDALKQEADRATP
jgi:hypothetical protein